MELFIGRQPILDTNKQIIAYELLFRGNKNNAYACNDGNEATLSVMGTALSHMGLTSLVGMKKAYINFTRDILVDRFSDILPRDQVVIEILEDIELDQEILEICEELRKKGFILALDDVTTYARCEAVLPYIHIIKLDWAEADATEKEKIANELKGKDVRLLAEKIETNEDYESAKAMGYTLFQGFFFSQPTVFSTKAIPARSSTSFKIVQEINKKDLSIDKATEIIKNEPALAFNLLKYLNSAAFSFGEKIISIKQALMLMGVDNMRRWIVTLAMAQACKDNPAVIEQAVERARFCEMLAPVFGIHKNAEELFILGLLSLGETLLKSPMDEILTVVHLSPQLERTLLGEETPYAPLLQLVIAQESNDSKLLKVILGNHSISDEQYWEVFESVVKWGGRF